MRDFKRGLVQLLRERSCKCSNEPIYKLASGKMSNFYINAKFITMSPEGMYLIGSIIFDIIKGIEADGIGGLTMGADPIANAVSLISYINGQPIPSFVVRKSVKDHGSKERIEGYIRNRGRVVIVDDVITTGGSTIEAIRVMKSRGFEIVKVIGLVDRQEGGEEAIKKEGYDLETIVSKEELFPKD